MPWIVSTTSSVSCGIDFAASRNRAVLKDSRRRLPESPIILSMPSQGEIILPPSMEVFMRTLLSLIAVAIVFACGSAYLSQSSPEAALIAKAKGIHDRVIKLDTHND